MTRVMYRKPGTKRPHRLQREAAAEARAVKREHGLRGWRVNTWENLGWHWELIALDGAVRLCPNTYGVGTAFKMDVHWPADAGVANFWIDGNVPRAMLQRAKRRIMQRLANLADRATAINELEI